MTIVSSKKTTSSYNRSYNKENRNNINGSQRSKVGGSRTSGNLRRPEYAWMDHAKTYNYINRKRTSAVANNY
jgi:hypothetical protein